MRQITKCEPSYFSIAKSKVELPKIKGAWADDNISKIRTQLRSYMLLEEQSLLCAYCQKEIDDNSQNSNIDHFKTRSLFPELTLEYSNLLVSCNTDERCSNFKDNNIKSRDEYENVVNPAFENPNDFFDYLPTGEIIAKNEKGQFTIDIFNLKDKSLTQCRLQIVKSLIHLKNFSLDEIYAVFPDYHSFIENIHPKLKEL
jgi:uncharacterized protein (TIGR02646 family)